MLKLDSNSLYPFYAQLCTLSVLFILRIQLRDELPISLWLVDYIVMARLRTIEAFGNLTGLACLVYTSLTGQRLVVSEIQFDTDAIRRTT